jgi:hypothetical protein
MISSGDIMVKFGELLDFRGRVVLVLTLAIVILFHALANVAAVARRW